MKRQPRKENIAASPAGKGRYCGSRLKKHRCTAHALRRAALRLARLFFITCILWRNTYHCAPRFWRGMNGLPYAAAWFGSAHRKTSFAAAARGCIFGSAPPRHAAARFAWAPAAPAWRRCGCRCRAPRARQRAIFAPHMPAARHDTHHATPAPPCLRHGTDRVLRAVIAAARAGAHGGDKFFSADMCIARRVNSAQGEETMNGLATKATESAENR